MGPSLLVADQLDGYILSDQDTYLAYSNAGNIKLEVAIQAQQSLLNIYSAIIDNPQNTNLTNTNFDVAKTFISYLVSNEGQQLMANYGVSTYGQQLFSPFVPLASGTAPNATLLSWIQNYAYINGTECPAAYRYNAGDLYSPSYDVLANGNLAASISFPNYHSADNQQFTIASPLTQTQNNAKINKI